MGILRLDGIRLGVRRLFRLGVRRPDLIREDVDEELRFYVDARVEYFIARGMPPDAARIEALRRLGSTFDTTRYHLHHSAQRRERRMSLFELATDIVQDLRYAARSLRRDKVFSGFVVATLALGIGANAAMFGVVDRLVLRGPEHVVAPDRVMRLYLTDFSPWTRRDETGSWFGYVMYENMKRATRSFEDVAAFCVNSAIIGHGIDAATVHTGYATADLFPLLGVHAQLGRFFNTAEDNVNGASPVVVISDGLWQGRFGGDNAVLGHSLDLGGTQYTIIGVAPHGFTGAELTPVDMWIPMSVRGPPITSHWTTSWNAQWLEVIGRLRPGVSSAAASAEATLLHRQSYNGTDTAMKAATITVKPVSFDRKGNEATEVTVSRWLVGVALIVLIITCANVANLLLARAMQRRREVAVRLALGAGRARLTRMLLTESVVLAAGGGVAALSVAYLTAHLMRTVLLPNIEWTSSPVDGRVLLACAVIALATGIIIGLAPALHAGRANLTEGLRAGVREGGGRRSRLRNALMVTQAALSVVLLIGTGLFVRSLWHVRTLDLGIQPDKVVEISLRWPRIADQGDSVSQARERMREHNFYPTALDDIRRLPGVTHATMAIGMSFESSFGVGLRVPGRDSIPKLKGGGPYVSAIASDYFTTVGTRLLRGRTFAAGEGAGTAPVAIVNQTMANTLWPGEDAIGKCLIIGDDPAKAPCATIVGVAQDARQNSLREDASMHYYIPMGQENGFGGTSLLLRPAGNPTALYDAVRKTLVAADPTLTYVNEHVLQESVDPQIRPWRLGAVMFGLCGLLALLVAAIGMYGVVSYLVTQRTHEIGVRIALGAGGGNIIGLVLRGGVAMALIGIAIGTALSLLGGRFIEPLLFETSARDPLVFGSVALVLLVVAIAACLLPAARARRVNPLEALRSE